MVRGRLQHSGGQLVLFGWLEVQCCLFAVGCYLLRLETAREVAVIAAFHLVKRWVGTFYGEVGAPPRVTRT